MARLGMDVDQVAAAGKALKERAAEIDALVGKLDGIVRSIHGVWEGPDSDQFVNDWWPEHKKTLVAASSHVAGLGQSALNNASEQRDASHGNGGANPGHTIDPGSSPAAQPPGGAPEGRDQNTAMTPPPSQEAFNARHGNYGDLNPGGANDGQCTSWVAFRRDQLGLGPAPHGRGLDGEAWAAHMPTQLDTPVPGAVGSSPNHTFIVESVNAGPPTSIQISEMNNSYLGGKGKVDLDTYTYNPATGLWKSPNQRSAHAMNFGT